MKVFYFVKVGKSDLAIHVTIVMAKKSSTKSISVFYAKKDWTMADMFKCLSFFTK